MEQMKIQPEDWKEDYKEFDDVRINDLIAVSDGEVELVTMVNTLADIDTAWRKCKYAASSYVRRCNGPGKA